MDNLNYIYNYNDVESLNMLRMKRAPFFALVTRLRTGGLLVDSIHTSVEEQVAMFLHAGGAGGRARRDGSSQIRADGRWKKGENEFLHAPLE